MADIVTTQILENGFSRVVMKFTNLSDGTGESGIKKVDASATGPLGVTVAGNTVYPGVHLKVTDIWFNVYSMGLRLQWQASSAVDMLVLSGWDHWAFRDLRAGFQGLINPNTSGATGSILFTTVGANLNASYSVILEMVKGVPQS